MCLCSSIPRHPRIYHWVDVAAGLWRCGDWAVATWPICSLVNQRTYGAWGQGRGGRVAHRHVSHFIAKGDELLVARLVLI
jgi:hypothetical protein